MLVVQRRETSYAEDIKFTRAVINRQSGPVVLVGHSYGGAVITEAGNDPKVAALVYIAAFAPDTGESAATIEKALPPATNGIKATDDGYFYIDTAVFAADFAADVSAAKAAKTIGSGLRRPSDRQSACDSHPHSRHRWERSSRLS